MLTETKAIAAMTRHLETLFPRDCPNCHRHYATLKEFFELAKPVGTPVSYDLEIGETDPVQPVGTVSLSNCPCGSTIALTSDGMSLFRMWSLLHWIKYESERRNLKLDEFLQYLRWEVRKQVLGRPDASAPLTQVRGL